YIALYTGLNRKWRIEGLNSRDQLCRFDRACHGHALERARRSCGPGHRLRRIGHDLQEIKIRITADLSLVRRGLGRQGRLFDDIDVSRNVPWHDQYAMSEQPHRARAWLWKRRMRGGLRRSSLESDQHCIEERLRQCLRVNERNQYENQKADCLRRGRNHQRPSFSLVARTRNRFDELAEHDRASTSG